MPPFTKPRGYSIGQMSRLTGVNIETVRYYERIGLMPKPDRTPGGNRQFDHDQLKRLSFIRRSRDLGFSIGEIRALLGMVEQEDASCGDVHQMTLQHLHTVREKIANLSKLETVLAGMVAECERGDVPRCPILDTLFEEPA